MFVGLDYHKKYTVATKMDREGNVIEKIKFDNEPCHIREFIDSLPKDSLIALEATGGWYYFYEQVENKFPDMKLADPRKVRLIAESCIKTDKIDSEVLANLLRTNFLPTSYIPPRYIRDNREILRYRASLVHTRTGIKNRVHAILTKNGVLPPFPDVFTQKGIRYMEKLELRPAYRLALDGYMKIIEAIDSQINEADEVIKNTVKNDPRAMLLTTVKGISYFSALLILSEIGDIDRFPSAKRLCSYAGLVPRVYSSGGKTHYGSITKMGSKWLRWILVEVSHHFTKAYPKFNRLYDRVAFRHGKNTARVTVAREMLRTIYYMLKENKSFEDTQRKEKVYVIRSA